MFLTTSFGKREKIEIPDIEGGHSGGDARIRETIFRKPNLPAHMRLPDSRAGALSCLTGIAARRSVELKRPVQISELVAVPPRG
jgi:hypothetical protein